MSAGSAGAATSASEQVSSNWAGYVVGGSDSNTQFSNVSGSWVQPTSKCSAGQDDAAFWVGIGGDDGQSSSLGQSGLGDGSSTSLEQIGTEGNCTGNGTQYYAWYELVPAAPVQLNLAIHPGDNITASVERERQQHLVLADRQDDRTVVLEDGLVAQPGHLECRVGRRGAVGVRRLG